MSIVEESPRNAWRLESPGSARWLRSARPGAPNKYFMVSADTHHTEPAEYLEAIEPAYRDRIPYVRVEEDGTQLLITEYGKPQIVKPGKRIAPEGLQSFEKSESGRHYGDRMDAEDKLRVRSALSVEQRLADGERDGIDAQVIFPNKGLVLWATPDPLFQMAMCRAFNRWAAEYFSGHLDTLLPMAMLSGADHEGNVAEAAWAADHGLRGVAMPAQPIFGIENTNVLQYNDPAFEPLWSTLEEAGMPLTFHVSTGRDPRAVGGKGGAIINYVCNSMATTIDPVVNLIASGVLERHPGLKIVTVESGVGWVPWMLESMDHSYRAHHMWVRPVIPEKPSTYYRRQCYSTFTEDHVGLALVEQLGLVDNFLWSNDYPHHEGTWPHSAEAIEREMGRVSEAARAKLLGLNAAKVFGLAVPAGAAP